MTRSEALGLWDRVTFTLNLRTPREIMILLASRYQVSPEALVRDVTEFLGRLRDRRLVEVGR